MAKLEGVKVIDMTNGEVTKVQYNSEEYAKVSGDAKAGDLLLSNETEEDIEEGAYYKCTSITSGGNVEFFDNDNDERTRSRTNYVVFRIVNESTTDKPTAERLKVGDLAKVIGNTSNHRFPIGEIVKVTGDKLAEYLDGRDFWHIKYEDITPYTPQAGDKLTIDGVEYTLVNRGAKAGEKVIVAATDDHRWKNGEIHEAKFINDIGILIYHEKGLNVVHKKHAQMLDGEYLVLVQTATESEVADDETTLTFVIKTKTGDIHEVLAEDSDIVTVSAFVEEYVNPSVANDGVFEYGLALLHPDVFVPYENIASITLKERD